MIYDDTLANLGESEKSTSSDNRRLANQAKPLLNVSTSMEFTLVMEFTLGLSTQDSLLPPSEPPDIKNWFSSYEYESLVLETNDNFGFSDPRELVSTGKNDSKIKKKTSGMVIKKCNQSEEENKCENQISDSPDSLLLFPVEEDSEACGIKNWFLSYAYESPALDTAEDLIFGDYKESMVHHNEKEVEKAENLDDLICNQILETCDNRSTKEGKSSSYDDDDGATENSFKRLPSPASDRNERCLETKGDSCQNSAGNGFVSIRRKSERGKDGKSKCGDQKRAASCAGKTRMTRKTLGDLTNIDSSHHVTGKWKCPRNMKPDIGPPLKQLRLGQWFHSL